MPTSTDSDFLQRNLFEGWPRGLPLATERSSNYGDEIQSHEGVKDQSVNPLVLTQTPEARTRALETRRKYPKALYGAAIAAHCLECAGTRKEVEDCQGDQLLDGTACGLYPARFRSLQREHTKTDLRRFIKICCKHCLGSSRDSCQSPNCSLYPVRFGRRPLSPQQPNSTAMH